MKVILFGATGMIGAGALIECLEDDDVAQVLAVVRRPTGRTHPKLTELIISDFLDYSGVEDQLRGYDACLYALGIASAGMSEADYRRITLDFAVAAGEALLRANPGMRLCFISGAGTDLHSRQMWARVKGEAEQALLAMPWTSAHMFRPALILPRKGVNSGVRSYRILYATLGWAFSLLKAVAPAYITTTEELGRALIHVARDGHPKSILEGADIHAAGA
ncbi:MAG: epimerase [Alphaproteobacteria bacterium]|nr:epimerase [Alphaproteobacteria bacterium]